MEPQDIVYRLGEVGGKLDSAINAIGIVGSEIKSLRDDFQTMEKGRLSRLEVTFATLETTVSLRAKNSAIVWAGGMSVVTSVVTAVLISLFV